MTDLLRLSDLLCIDAALSSVSVSGLSLDSRNVRRGDAFIALAGQSSHGLAFAESARAHGAVAIVYDGPVPNGVIVPDDAVQVIGLRQRLGTMANRLYGQPSQRLSVVAVTGTNGKTSIVHLLVQAWQLSGLSAASIGTMGVGLNGHLHATGMTTPDVLQMHRILADIAYSGADHVSVEASSHALDQGRLDGVEFRFAVFTNLSRDHLDYHQSMEQYGQAKSRLFFTPKLQTAILNFDDPFILALAQRLPPRLQVLGYSVEGKQEAVLRAHAITLESAAMRFEIEYLKEKKTLSTPLMGRFNVGNLLAVAGVLLAQGRDLASVVHLLAGLKPVKGRMECIVGNQQHGTIVVDYAHTPDALAKVLAALREKTQGRIICVFGCGGQRDQGKRAPMGAIAEAGADTIILTDDNPRDEDGDAIIRHILAGCHHPDMIKVERHRESAIRLAIALARPADSVLIAGKGHETSQIVAGHHLSFDDMAVVQRILAATPVRREAH